MGKGKKRKIKTELVRVATDQDGASSVASTPKQLKRSSSSNAVDLELAKLDMSELEEMKAKCQAELDAMGGAVSTRLVRKPQDDIQKSTAHWDYLLQEMKWMSKDFKTERKWKEQQQRRIVKSALRARERMFNPETQRAKNMKIVVRRVCKEVKSFWEKVDRIIIYKHKAEFYAKQTEAMDKHLEYLVGQTERYSNLLANKLKNSTQSIEHSSSPHDEEGDEDVQADNEEESDLSPSDSEDEIEEQEEELNQLEDDLEKMSEGVDVVDNEEDDNEEWDDELEEDDEGTIEREDETKPEHVSDELSKLKEEAEMSREELLKRYGGYQEAKDEDDEDEDEWNDELEEDDEGTMEKEDETKPEDVDNEIDQLKKEAEMSREELMKLYGVDNESSSPKQRETYQDEEDSDGDDDADDWDDELEEDDEGTMEKEDETKPEEVDNEINQLKQEAEMSREELMKLYGLDQDDHPDEKKEQDDEEDWDDELEEDDEGTLENEDETKPEDVDAELNQLKEEAEMSREELLKLYGVEHESSSKKEKEEEDDEDDQADWDDELEEDDEETMEKEDETKPDEVQNELDQLKREADVSREELMKLYGLDEEKQTDKMEEEEDDQDDWNEELEEDDEGTIQKEDETKPEEVENELDQLKREAEMSKEELMKLYAGKESLEESSTRDEEEMPTDELDPTVNGSPEDQKHKVEVPFLMADDLRLREYQRAGLDWLVSMFERKLNGILADEMGLGKTVQTISMLAYLASARGIWGPHLIIVPTSVLLNWEMEFKKFCPGFKILTYYGSIKERRLKRIGWTKPNAFHVCITSYQLAVQDANIFKRKKWFYLILDEAHNIKNFRSQRWQTLLTFNTKRRLLLTGTPLQNSLMELWSLMHFLMPHVFRSQSEFKYWFSNPLNAVVEGKGRATAAQVALAKQQQDRHYAGVIKRLHTVMRPFLLRRLKADVATQLPGKYEHIVRVPLSRRQRYLYEDFISRSSTRQALTSGGYLGMMAILMKLRMVCNHPDIFEPRVIESPLQLREIMIPAAALSYRVVKRFGRRFNGRDILPGLELDIGGIYGFADRELSSTVSRSDVKRMEELRPPKKVLVEVLQSVEFQHPDDYKTFDDSGFSKSARSILEKERDQLRKEHQMRLHQITETMSMRNANMTRFEPIYGPELRQIVTLGARPGATSLAHEVQVMKAQNVTKSWDAPCMSSVLGGMVKTMAERFEMGEPILQRFVFITPKAMASTPVLDFIGKGGNGGKLVGDTMHEVREYQNHVSKVVRAYHDPNPDHPGSAALFHSAAIRLTLSFPDKMLVQYDCGKLQILAEMLREKKANGHRVLIFTQMTRMLDILEVFLNIHGYIYFRLDGSTKVDARQRMMEKFNRDPRIFAFILSTRSGGLGINLTGADTVIFYDSDWNPSMDAQAQDRAHRIGQTRDVHIYRLISEHTIEENILTKANQKRELNKLSVEDGKFTVDTFRTKGGSITDLLGGAAAMIQSGGGGAKEIEAAMASAEDESDKLAASRAAKEAQEDLDEFDESLPMAEQSSALEDQQDPQQQQQKDSDQQEPTEEEVAEEELNESQFEDIENRVSPVERYSINFRTEWFPVVDRLRAQLQFQAMDAAQQHTWEMERLEAEREMMEDDMEEELIVAADGTSFDISQYYAAKNAIRNAKTLGFLTGKMWISCKDKDTGRPFYHCKESGETTWLRPKILDSIHEQKVARKLAWGGLPTDVMVRIFQMAETPQERLDWGLTCRRWARGLKSGNLCLWVDSCYKEGFLKAEQEEGKTLPDFDQELLTVGSWAEALFNQGDTWYPCLISDVFGDGTFEVTYTDGQVERGVRRAHLRRDRGGRYTYVTPTDGSAPYGIFNKYLNSNVGASTPPPPPQRFSSLEDALNVAKDGDVIVLRAGLHKLSPYKLEKNVRIVSERNLAEELGKFQFIHHAIRSPVDNTKLDRMVLEEQDQEHLEEENTAQPTSSTKAEGQATSTTNGSKKASSLATAGIKPPPPVEIIGVGIDEFKDQVEERHAQAALEEKVLTKNFQARSPVALAKREAQEAYDPWTYEQATGLECPLTETLEIAITGKIHLSGIAFFRPKPGGKIAKGKSAVTSLITVTGGATVWFHDCTLSNLNGSKDESCLAVKSAPTIVSLSESTICSAPHDGIVQTEGNLILLDCEICGNDKDGVRIDAGILIAKRCEIYNNGSAPIHCTSTTKINVLLQDNDLRGNAKEGVAGVASLPKELFADTHNLVHRKDRFEFDPYEQAQQEFEKELKARKQREKQFQAKLAAAAKKKAAAPKSTKSNSKSKVKPKKSTSAVKVVIPVAKQSPTTRSAIAKRTRSRTPTSVGGRSRTSTASKRSRRR